VYLSALSCLNLSTSWLFDGGADEAFEIAIFRSTFVGEFDLK
jgi:hypothetical protein